LGITDIFDQIQEMTIDMVAATERDLAGAEGMRVYH